MDTAYRRHRVDCCGHDPAVVQMVRYAQEWFVWRTRYSWPERASAHDESVAEEARLKSAADIVAMNARHTQIAIAMQNLIVARLQDVASKDVVHAVSPVAMARVFELAVGIERQARGLPGAIVKQDASVTLQGAVRPSAGGGATGAAIAAAK